MDVNDFGDDNDDDDAEFFDEIDFVKKNVDDEFF